MPLAVLSTTSTSLEEHITGAAGLIAHAPGGTVCCDVDEILRVWDSLVAVDVTHSEAGGIGFHCAVLNQTL